MEEAGRIVTGQSADTDTVVASVKAYVNALNKLVVRRQKTTPDIDKKSVNYKDRLKSIPFSAMQCSESTKPGYPGG